MTTSTGNFVCDNSSLANFKNWAQAISNAISGFGWVQTADTGQVNWGSIASVPSGTYVYEIWKANDALAATMPIYLKIEYGSSSTQVNIRMTAGTSSNGSGTITGQIISSAPWQITQTGSNPNQGATTFPCFFSGSAGEFRMWMWAQPTGSPNIATVFGIERSKDGSGNDTNSYFTVLTCGQNSNQFQQTIKASAAGLRDNGIMAMGGTNGVNTGSSFGTVAAFPVFPVLGLIGNPMIGFMSAYATDAAINSICTVSSMYGGTHTYVVFGAGSISGHMGQRNNNGATMVGLMRYE